MGFLDNSGDIILDAVLTDAGRKRLARGDGTFKVTKYAFGDDEIDYGKYDPNHISGSAYYDLEILQTPVLEAFTNNRSSMQRKLMSVTNNNLLFLPVIVVNEVKSFTGRPSDGPATGSYVVGVDSTTIQELSVTALADQLIDGSRTQGQKQDSPHIRVDQGLDTDKLSADTQINAELREDQYLIQIDHRLGRIWDINGGNVSSPAFIDDDQVASYYVTKAVGKYVINCSVGALSDSGDPSKDTGGVGGIGNEVIKGPRGTKLRFGILSSPDLRSSTYLFTTLGSTVEYVGGSGTVKTYYILDTTIKATGVTTGYSLDLPVRFIKWKSTP